MFLPAGFVLAGTKKMMIIIIVIVIKNKHKG